MGKKVHASRIDYETLSNFTSIQGAFLIVDQIVSFRGIVLPISKMFQTFFMMRKSINVTIVIIIIFIYLLI